MPVDRFFHPRAGHSQKVAALSHFEFRVWWTYVLAADDYGVMRATAITLQAANGALAKRLSRLVENALHRLIEVELITSFIHQDDEYVCQLNWQDFQHIRYPRESTNPAPPQDVIERCTPDTQILFATRVPGPSGESNASERRLSAALAATLTTQFQPDAVETEYRIGNSYADVVAHFGDTVWVFEVKKGELTSAAISQALRYREALRTQWPTKQIEAAVVGRAVGKTIAEEARSAEMVVLIHDHTLKITTVISQATWQFPVTFQLSHRELTGNLPSFDVNAPSQCLAHAGGREEANANGKRKRQTQTQTQTQTADAGAREAFDRFWAAYPRKVGKEAAWRWWQANRPPPELVSTMLTALEAQTQQPDWRRERGRFIPHPATWLHQGRWQDEPAATHDVVSDRTRQNLDNAAEAERLIREGSLGPK